MFYDPSKGDPIPPLLDPKAYSDEWKEFTPSASLRWQINDDMMAWASYAEGFKSGGFFGRQANFDCCDPTFEPEFVKNYELGLKTTLAGGKLTFNPTVFFSDYEDKQESILIPIDLSNVATVVRNAATQKIFGVELEMSYQITENWFLRANYGYIDAEYDKYLADINGDQIVTDNSDLIPRQVPENTFGISTTYTAYVGPGALQGSLSFRYRDEVELEPSNDPIGHMDSDRVAGWPDQLPMGRQPLPSDRIRKEPDRRAGAGARHHSSADHPRLVDATSHHRCGVCDLLLRGYHQI